MVARKKMIAAVALVASAGCGGSSGGGGASASSTAPPVQATTTVGVPVASQPGVFAGSSSAPGLSTGSVAPGAISAPMLPTQAALAQGSSGSNTGSIIGNVVGSVLGSIFGSISQTQKLSALGQALFHDKILSGNQNVSCSTCHNAASGLSDGLSLSLGAGATGVGPSRQGGLAQMTSRHAPALFDTGASGYGGSSQSFFWDSRVTFSPLVTPDPNLTTSSPSADYQAIVNQLGSPLAAQALFPVLDPGEMRGNPGENEIANAPDNLTAWKLLMARLVGTNNGTVGGIQGYRDLFAAAYPGVALDDLNFGHATQAISVFVGQNFTAQNSPYDDYVNNGNSMALTSGQVNGMNLFFGQANCSVCHSGSSFSDFLPHGAAVPQLGPGRLEPGDDRGVALVSGSTADDYKFRTPSLRNVALGGVYMHDGAYTTLEGAVRHMLNPQSAFASYDPTQLRPDFAATLDTNSTRNAARVAAVDPVFATTAPLSDSDVHDLVDFLGTLTDPNAASSAASAKPSSVPSGLPID